MNSISDAVCNTLCQHIQTRKTATKSKHICRIVYKTTINDIERQAERIVDVDEELKTKAKGEKKLVNATPITTKIT